MLKVKELRLSKGLSVPKLAELAGLHRRTIEDLEKRGDCMISNAYKIAKALNVTLNDIYGEDGGE